MSSDSGTEDKATTGYRERDAARPSLGGGSGELELELDAAEKDVGGHAQQAAYVVEPGYPPLLRKLDRRIIPMAAFIYLLCFLDRSNIGNAKVLNEDAGHSLVQDLGLVGNQYVISLMVFLIAYTIFETPSNYMLKRMRPNRWIAIIMAVWGVLCMCIAAVKGFGALTAIRFLVGVAEAGLFPGFVYFLTFWYRPEERSVRVAVILASATLAGAFGGAIAYGVGKIDGRHGLSGWQWLMIIEGAPSVFFAGFVWFLFPSFPERATWLTPAERDEVARRLVGVSSHGQARMTWADAKATLVDWRLYLHYLAYICISVPFSSISLFSPTIVAGLNYKGLQAQLFTIPPYAIAYVFTIVTAFSADRTNSRSLHSFGGMLLGAICFLVEAVLPDTAFKARYAMLCLATTGSFACIPPLLGWLSSNLRTTAGVGLAVALNVSFGGPGQIIGVWIYKAAESPGYVTGHSVNAAFLFFGAAIVMVLRLIYSRRNRNLPEGAVKWVL
ncbi:major facilitator superfamily domain-containing protein [Dipodascopsis tothii]|uniref:major facilitator superfamily domain-containing protein n=1 Tax=Dipodascopsis tothii TaxID=44089 RepID=UPI0034CF743D